MKTAAIVHGWAEGNWQSRAFVRQLKTSGFEVVSNCQKADVLIAHSAGCYLVPSETQAKLILLIGLPLWPGKSVWLSLLEKLKLEAKQHQKRHDIGWFISKLLHNTWYIAIKPRSFWRFFKNRKDLKLPKVSPTRKVVLVRNKGDRFCSPNVIQLLGTSRGYKFIEMPGLHDDCWLEPTAYIDLLLKEL